MKPQIFLVPAIMGAPASSAQAGDTEVWTYNSGNGRTDTFGSVFVSNPGGPVIGGFAPPSTSFGSVIETSTSRSCKVDIVMRDDKVQRINYSGPTGGLLTKGEQCAFAIDNCARQMAAAAAAATATPKPVPNDKLAAPKMSQRRRAFGVVFDDGPGLRVWQVQAGGVGERAGIEEGDDILAFDGTGLGTRQELQKLVDRCNAGDTKEITLSRGGEEITVDARF